MIKSYPKKEAWLKQVDEIKAKDQKRLEEDYEPNKTKVPIHPSVLAKEACDFLDKDATIILDGYSASHFMTERFKAGQAGAVLDAGGFAGVGHGVGMGIGAQVARPGKQICVIMGDGGMGLGGFDVETAVRCELPVCYLLSDNRGWMAANTPIYKKAIPVLGKQDYTPFFMVPTRYDQIFAAMGAYTERVEKPEDIKPAMERAFKSGKTSVIDVVVDPAVAPTPGRGATNMEQMVKRLSATMDPEDFPDEIRAKYIDKK